MDRKEAAPDAFAPTIAASDPGAARPASELDDATLRRLTGDPTLPDARAGSGPSSLSDAPSLQPTARIGRYAILRKLGEGGMGLVLIGYDESLDRKAAVKVLHRGVAAEQWLLREAQALAKLSHPNVVPVFEVGQHEGRVFLAMEYVEGTTLREHIEGASRSIDDVIRMFLQAGRGLAAAHAAGLVHRDFKPDNVLVGHDGRARVADFGIAALADRKAPAGPAAPLAERPIGASPGALVSPLTQEGALMGTPAFMSPEQLRGEPATTASDQFSFCVALYNAVHAQAPFEGETLLELAANVCAGKLRPPPSKSAAPPWLRDILRRGLSVKPADRYPTLAALLDELEAKLPRKDDDPALVRREQVLLSGILIAYSAAISLYFVVRGTGGYSPAAVVASSALFLLVCVIGVGAVWKGLRRNAFGRKFGALVIGLPLTMVAHRMIALGLGTPVYHVVAVDCFLLFLVFLLAALLIDRRFWPTILLGVGVIVAAVLVPQRSPVLLGLYGMVGLGTGIVLWGRSR
jgi:eukaryotic-like serine/threonine-protein kinase